MNEPRKRTFYDWILEILSFIFLIWAFFPLFFYGSISSDTQIPIHYNVHGEVDGWGSRSYLWILPLISLVFYIGFYIIERFYKKFNYPIKVTIDNANSLYRLGVEVMRHIKLFIILGFAYINNSAFAIVMGKEAKLNSYFTIAFIGVLFLTIFIYTFKMIRAKKSSSDQL